MKNLTSSKILITNTIVSKKWTDLWTGSVPSILALGSTIILYLNEYGSLKTYKSTYVLGKTFTFKKTSMKLFHLEKYKWTHTQSKTEYLYKQGELDIQLKFA